MPSGSHNRAPLDKPAPFGRKRTAMTRRDAARKLSLFLAGSPLLRAQETPWMPNRQVAMDELYNVLEFEPIARERMLKTAYDYIAGGVDDEWTLRRNRA